MGRYRSSPQCSHCWQQGHTKRGCPTYREKAEKWLAEHPDAEGYDKPYWVREVEGYKNIAKNRKCSWCEEVGHTKRTCPDLKKVKAKNISKNKEWRAQVLDKMKEVGLGVGALVRDTRRIQRLYMISNLNWDKLNLTASGDSVVERDEYSKWNYKNGAQYPEMTIERIGEDRKTSTYMPMLNDEQSRELLYYGSTNLEIVSPVVPSPPSGWVDDESWAKKLF